MKLALLLPLSLMMLAPLPRTAVAEPVVQIIATDPKPDTFSTQSLNYSPIRVTDWIDANHNGVPDVCACYQNETILAYEPSQSCTVDGLAWVLRWHDRAPWWVHPDDAATHGAWRTIVHGRYIIPLRAFPAPTITLNTSGPSYDVTVSQSLLNEWAGGETSTRQYDPAEPGEYGSCNVTRDALGGYGNWWGTPFDVQPGFTAYWTADHAVLWFTNQAYPMADFDHSGTVSVQDVFGFIAAYCAGDARADVDRSGALETADILTWLGAWFEGR